MKRGSASPTAGAPTPSSDSSSPSSVVPRALQPLTPRGAAGFSQTSFLRLCLFQSLVALTASITLVWFFQTAVFPTVREALQQLPEEGTLRSGELRLVTPVIQPLAENSWFSIAVDLEQLARSSSGHDLEIRFARSGVQLCTGLGCSYFRYPADLDIPFNRIEARSWWNAWQPMLLTAVAFGAFFLLFLIWTVLATVYCPVPLLVAYAADRSLTLQGAWRLAGAALMPGACLMILGLLALGMGWIEPVRFLLVAGVHLALPVAYLFISPFYLPESADHEKIATNPFGDAPTPPERLPAAVELVNLPSAPELTAEPEAKNPFIPEPADPPKSPPRSPNPFAAS